MADLSDEDLVPIESVQKAPPGSGHDPAVVAAIAAWCSKLADTYAGLILSEGVIYVGFVTDVRRHLSALRSAFPQTRLKGFTARHTFAELRATLDGISHDLPDLRREGIRIGSIGVDPSRNAVVVRLDRSGADRARRELSRRYPSDALLFELGEAFYLTDAAHTT